MIYEDSTSLFDTLLEKDISFSVRDIRQLALEMYKVTKGLAPIAILSLFLYCKTCKIIIRLFNSTGKYSLL